MFSLSFIPSINSPPLIDAHTNICFSAVEKCKHHSLESLEACSRESFSICSANGTEINTSNALCMHIKTFLSDILNQSFQMSISFIWYFLSFNLFLTSFTSSHQCKKTSKSEIFSNGQSILRVGCLVSKSQYLLWVSGMQRTQSSLQFVFSISFPLLNIE